MTATGEASCPPWQEVDRALIFSGYQYPSGESRRAATGAEPP